VINPTDRIALFGIRKREPQKAKQDSTRELVRPVSSPIFLIAPEPDCGRDKALLLIDLFVLFPRDQTFQQSKNKTNKVIKNSTSTKV